MRPSKRAFITAIDGFLGRYLAAELTDHGYEVFGTTRRPNGLVGQEACDINDQARLTELMSSVRPDVVFHLAAITVAEHDSAREVYTTNFLGTLALLEAIASSKINCRKVLLTSSGHIYGNQSRSPISEDFAPMPASDYAVSKLSVEYLARLWSERLPLIVARPFNFAGVGQSLNRLLPKLVDHFARGAAEIELGNTEVARDFSDVRDVADNYRRLTESTARNVVVNVCSGESHSVAAILDILTKISGRSVAPRTNSNLVREIDVKALCGDNRLLESIIGPLRHHRIEETLHWMYAAAVSSEKR